MANSASHAALPYPIKGARYTLQVPYLDADGDPTDPTTPDTELSGDGGSFADCAEEVSTFTGSNGVGHITLTGAETNYSEVAMCAKVASGPKATLATLYPRVLAIVGSGTLSAGSAGGGTLGTLLAYDVTGCFVKTTGGTGGGGTGGANNQARKIITYNTGTGAFTVAPNWETTPSTDTTYDVLLPEGVTLGMLRTLNPTTPGRTLAVGTSGQADTNVTQFGGNNGTFASGIPDVNVSKINNVTTVAVTAIYDKLGMTNTAGTNFEEVYSTDFASNYDTTNDRWKVGVEAIAADAIDAAAVASDIVTEIQSGLATTTEISNLSADLAKVPKSDGTVTWNATALASIQSEANDALVANNLDHLILSAVDTNFATTVHLNSVIGHLADAGTSATFDRTTDALEILGAATAPSAASIADAVWEEAIADHSGTSGSTAEQLAAAGAAGDPWATALPGSYTSGQAGKIVGDNINATITSRMATYTQPTGFLAATFPTTVASTTNITAGTITTVTNLTNAPTSGDFTATMKASIATELATYDPPTNTEMVAAFTEIKGSTWASTDTLENIRDEQVVIDGIVDSILVDTAEIGAAGAGLTNINLPNQTMDIVGNITGNLSGSVGSVTGAINTAAGTITTLDALDTAQDSQHSTTQAAVADVPTVAEFEARTLVAANYFDPAADTVARVTLVDTTTTNTDMLTAAAVNAEVLDVLATDTLVDGKSIQAALRYLASVVAGKISGAGTGTETFIGIDGSTTRVTVTVDGDGNRSGVSYD